MTFVLLIDGMFARQYPHYVYRFRECAVLQDVRSGLGIHCPGWQASVPIAVVRTLGTQKLVNGPTIACDWEAARSPVFGFDVGIRSGSSVCELDGA